VFEKGNIPPNMSAVHNLPRGIDTDELDFYSLAWTEIALENGYHTESSS
jgi:hypothetical protein